MRRVMYIGPAWVNDDAQVCIRDNAYEYWVFVTIHALLQPCDGLDGSGCGSKEKASMGNCRVTAPKRSARDVRDAARVDGRRHSRVFHFSRQVSSDAWGVKDRRENWWHVDSVTKCRFSRITHRKSWWRLSLRFFEVQNTSRTHISKQSWSR